MVIDGLKLQPCNQGFVDACDAILAADQGTTISRTDGTAAFDLPPNTSTGLNELNKESGMVFWPNPNQSEFEILMTKKATSIDVKFYGITGKQVYNQTLIDTISSKGLTISVYEF